MKCSGSMDVDMPHLDGFGATELQSDKGDTEQSRKSQGYGGGSGVGA